MSKPKDIPIRIEWEKINPRLRVTTIKALRILCAMLDWEVRHTAEAGVSRFLNIMAAERGDDFLRRWRSVVPGKDATEQVPETAGGPERKTDEPKRQISLSVYPDTAERLRLFAALAGARMTDVADEAILRHCVYIADDEGDRFFSAWSKAVSAAVYPEDEGMVQSE